MHLQFQALKLSKKALGETASGKIVNLLSNDVSRFDLVSILANYMWVAPTTSLCVIYFLWVEAGYAAIIGIIPFFIVLPLQSMSFTVKLFCTLLILFNVKVILVNCQRYIGNKLHSERMSGFV